MINDDWMVSAAGVRMPRIVYGTAWKKAQTAALVGQALRLGFRGIDTACQPRHYDEPGVGAGVAAFLSEQGQDRASLYLQTKFTPPTGQDPARVPYDPRAPLAKQVAQSFQASQRNLQVSYVDALLLHSPLADAGQTAEAWKAMEAIAGAGGARQLGISNCYEIEELQALYLQARIKPAVVQNRFYAESGYDRGIRAFCKAHGMVYQSFWTLSANPQILAHPVVRGLAAKHRRTAPQVLFRYLTQEGVVPLTGTRSAVHMRESLEIFGFMLQEAERAALSALL